MKYTSKEGTLSTGGLLACFLTRWTRLLKTIQCPPGSEVPAFFLNKDRWHRETRACGTDLGGRRSRNGNGGCELMRDADQSGFVWAFGVDLV